MQMKLMTADAVADMLAVSRARVYELARTRFPKDVTVRLGRRMRFNGEALKKWIENGGASLEECGK
jgi:excisionase family DNA binding protein